MAKHILFKFASRERPDKLTAGIENIIKFCDNKQDYSILISVDNDDRSMLKMFPTVNAIQDFKRKYPNIHLKFGESKNKIHAINRDIANYEVQWDILVNFSDDMEWIVQGFDNIIRDAFVGKEGSFLHVHDQHPYNNVIAAMSIMDKEYYKLDGNIYHPEYKSFYCDNEAFDVAKLRGRYISLGAGVQLFRHNHPMWSKDLVADRLYKENNKYWKEDKETYEKRKSINFNL